MPRVASNPQVRPSIYVTATEFNTLVSLALSGERRHPNTSALLLAELDRAVLCSAESLPDHTVTMNSIIEFLDEGTGACRTVQLVYPQSADIEAGRLSIMTPVGAALIGMMAGHSIRWPDRDGNERLLRILRVEAGLNLEIDEAV